MSVHLILSCFTLYIYIYTSYCCILSILQYMYVLCSVYLHTMTLRRVYIYIYKWTSAPSPVVTFPIINRRISSSFLGLYHLFMFWGAAWMAVVSCNSNLEISFLPHHPKGRQLAHQTQRCLFVCWNPSTVRNAGVSCSNL